MIYFDHNATTPPAPEVMSAMLEVMGQHWANSSSQHGPGQDAKRLLAQARARVAQVLGCKAVEVVFTSGATEANHMAVRGLLAAAALTPRLRRPVLLALAAAAVVLALTPLLSPPTYQKLVLHFVEQIGHFWTSNYGQLYVRALNMIASAPLTGLGFDGFDQFNPFDPLHDDLQARLAAFHFLDRCQRADLVQVVDLRIIE